MNLKEGLLLGCVIIAITLTTVCGRVPPPPKPQVDYYEPLEKDALETPPITTWGKWGKWQKCDPRFLVTGFQLLVEQKEKDIDNTALNGVGFICGRPHLPDYKEMAIITSSTGSFGTYRNKSFCAQNQYATGIQLKSQHPQAGGDDVAAVNLKLICSDGEELEGYDEQEDFYPVSLYTRPILCSQGKGICGIQTQVESFQAFGDDTTLNNIRISCCELPLPATTTTELPPPPTTTTELPPAPTTTTELPPPPTTTTEPAPPPTTTTELPPPPTTTTELPPPPTTTTEPALPPTTTTELPPPPTTNTELPPLSTTTTEPPTTEVVTEPPTPTTEEILEPPTPTTEEILEPPTITTEPPTTTDEDWTNEPHDATTEDQTTTTQSTEEDTTILSTEGPVTTPSTEASTTSATEDQTTTQEATVEETTPETIK